MDANNVKNDTDKKQSSTTSLFQKLFVTPDIADFMVSNSHEFSSPTFHETILNICNEKRLIPEQVILHSGIERTYGHQLFNGTRKPSREKVLQLAFGLQLDLEETQKLLQIARKNALYPKIKRDAAIIFCLNNQKDFFDTQSVLQALNLTLLGSETKHG
jgi:hypothetical protein